MNYRHDFHAGNFAGVFKHIFLSRALLRLGAKPTFSNADKGYCFIKPDGGGRDIFVHIAAVERAGLRSLNDGQRASYEIEADKKGKGPKAADLHSV
ncbi:MAG: hypothetical protein DLM68_01345 [Hyphomicrobiales bacterium]|nr:MAG: hypothetical protein DLM68_01345 [Hyphomicrobiales bacterium]